MDAEGKDARGGDTTPSRISMAALCTPNGSPLPHTSNGINGNGNGNGSDQASPAEEDVTMKEAAGEKAGSGEEALGEHDTDEGEDEEEEDEEEDEEDEEEEEEGEGSESENGSFQSVSEMEGVEGGEKQDRLSAEGENRAVVISSDTAQPSSDAAETSATGQETVEGVQAGVVEGADGEAKQKEAPKRKKPKRRSPSVDVSLPMGPPARPTMRLKLTIAHNDEERYLTNVPEAIYENLKEKKHAWADWYESTMPESGEGAEAGPSEGPDLSELGGLAKLLAKYPSDKAKEGGGKKKKKFDEYDIGQYNTKDPFVDDSELGVDEPTHSAKPSADGFFVTQGEVELEKAIAAARDMKTGLGSNQSGAGKKVVVPVGFGQPVEGGGGGAGAVTLQLGPNADSVSIINRLVARHSVEFGMISPAAEDDESRQSYFNQSRPQTPTANEAAGMEGSRQSPIKFDDDERPNPSQTMGGVKYPTRPVSKRLEREFDMLRQKVAKESWLKKAKFPPDLRDPLMQASKVAVALNEYSDNFFNWLPRIFPYNRLTLHKYTKRQFLGDHCDVMRRLQDLNVDVLQSQINQALPMLQQEYDEARGKWVHGGGQQQASDGGVGAEEERALVGDEQAETAEVDGEEGVDKGEEESVGKGGPVKRWRWTEPMREVLFTIITIDNATTELKNEKISLEGSTERASVINARKIIYKKVCDLWPEDGWTTTTAISREYALYKRKVDRYTLQHHESLGKDIHSAIAL